jgi:hypothetical protein
MTKIQRVGLMLWVGTTLVLLAGCNKLLDYLHDHPDGTVDLCQIQKMKFYFFNDSIDIDFTYNSWGAPVSVIQSRAASGHPDGLFRYDSKHRLTDYIEAYKNGGFETWHRYVYDKNNVIIRDTTYIFGILGDEPPAPDEVYDIAVVYYEYDDKNRIIHTKQQWFSDPDPTHSLDLYYQYDGNGNLVAPYAVYDDKINVHRTNKVWMFIDRNYSVNNAYASAYNEYGLPTKVELIDPVTRLAGFYTGKGVITYKCK